MTNRARRKRIAASVFAAAFVGLIGLINLISRPQFQTYQTVDALQFLATGICFGVALAGLFHLSSDSDASDRLPRTESKHAGPAELDRPNQVMTTDQHLGGAPERPSEAILYFDVLAFSGLVRAVGQALDDALTSLAVILQRSSLMGGLEG